MTFACGAGTETATEVTTGTSTAADRSLAWMSSTSIVFPVAALAVSLLTFATMPPTPAIAGLLAIALLPWALVAGGVEVPSMAVLVVTAVTTAWLTIRLDDQATLFLGVVMCSWAAAKGLRWATILSFVSFSAISVGCTVVSDKDNYPAWIIWSTGMAFGCFAGTLLFRQQMLTDQLAAARSGLALAAAESERKAIAREVHDIVGHSLTVVLLNIAGARRHLATNPVAAAEAMERAESISRDSLETVRSVVNLLSSTDDSQRDPPLPGGADIVPLLEQAQRSGLPVTLTVSGNLAELEPALGLTVVRLLQEALANATRHAPGEMIDVDLQVTDACVTATVSNAIADRSASGVLAARAGLGVAGMTDRVTAVHGSLDAGVRDGRWVVRAFLPRSMSRSTELSLR